MQQAVFARPTPSIPPAALRAAALRDVPLRDAPLRDAPLRIADRLDDDASSFLGTIGGSMVQTILDHVHFGVTVIGAQMRLLFANKAAQRECARHPVLRIDRGQLVMLESGPHGEFMRALDAARNGRWSLVQMVHGDDRMMLAVLPLWPNAPCADSPALVVFGLRSHCKPLAIQFYAQSCGLTPAETAVLRALSEGLAPKEIASRHDVALSTVRTQLGSIREKTGARNITDLVLTLGCLPPIMPAALSAM